MRKKTEKTLKLISELLEQGPMSKLILEFGFRECGAIPNFFSMCLNWKDENAWLHLNEWMKEVPIEDLSWLDTTFRNRSYISGIFEYEFDSRLPIMVRCLMAFHVNGRAREKALESIGENFTGEELPFILLRLNDWAEPIRNLAKRLILQRLKIDFYAEHFLRNIFLVDRLRDCWRWSHEEILEQIYSFIAKGNPERIKEVIENGNKLASLAAFNLYESFFINDLTSLVISALKSPHPRLHLKCSGKIDFLDNLSFTELLDFLLESRPPLRVAAMRSFCKRFPSQQIDFLKGVLLNPSSLVREYAVWALNKRLDDFDAGQFYRDSLKVNLTITGLRSVGQFGDSTDLKLLKKALNNERKISLKKAALESLVRIGDENSKNLLYDFIGEEGYSRIIKKFLTPKISSEDVERLFNLYLEGNVIVRRNIRNLIKHLPDTEHGIILMNLSFHFEEFKNELCGFLGNSNFYCTSQANKDLMMHKYDKNKKIFNAQQRKFLEFTFKYWRN